MTSHHGAGSRPDGQAGGGRAAKQLCVPDLELFDFLDDFLSDHIADESADGMYQKRHCQSPFCPMTDLFSARDCAGSHPGRRWLPRAEASSLFLASRETLNKLSSAGGATIIDRSRRADPYPHPSKTL
jgi:hypothetical protein